MPGDLQELQEGPMFLAPLLVALLLPTQQQPPRDPKVAAGIVLDDAAREAALVKRIAASPADITAYQQLAKLQEHRGAYAEAEATLLKARQVAPKNNAVVLTLSGFYNRQGQFEKTMQTLEEAEEMDPTDPRGAQIVATYYWDKAYRDHRLLPAEQLQYVMSGIAATDRALSLNPDYVEALTYKNLLVRMRANLETDPFQKQQLIAEADTLRSRAIELNKGRTAIDGGNSGVMLGPPPPPPPPPPPGAAPTSPSGMAPVRVGGNIKTPTKVKNVPPVYPPDALAARIEGVVILEVTIDTEGRVYDAKVLRSIPVLDNAALEAVRQWEFTTTEFNGMRDPVSMTVTVNFTLQ
jgi:TonB family protein